MTGDVEHYFTAQPASPAQLRERSVALAGKSINVVVASGVFSPDGVDRGTAVLLNEVPDPPGVGTFLDLGCGWGPIALTLALRSPGAIVYGVDVNERALDLLRRNASRHGLSWIRAVAPDAVPADVRFDLIWSNPPIRIGKAALHELLQSWLPRLAPGGTAYLVVAKQLGADSLQKWIAKQWPDFAVDRYASDKGFRVLRVQG
ncbi:MAG: methyltransferase [Tetrasphaera sp.]|nr:class I SAM-dependent methyltransferase [Actinomycetota bacterium]MCB1300869.1 methyltransferase [Tetrasphaera sp.]HRW02146.1 methyltransferase [Tetrasphaera sp.]